MGACGCEVRESVSACVSVSVSDCVSACVSARKREGSKASVSVTEYVPSVSVTEYVRALCECEE